MQESRNKHGLNVFTQHERKSFFSQYLDSFGDPIIKILLAALALNIIFMFSQHNWFETIGIAVAVFLATFVSTLSEYGSESAFIKLQQEASKMQCRVKRQNGLQQLPITEIVVGDIVLLQAGERVPADGILISGDLKVDQSAINGESAEVSKKPLNSTDTRWSPEIKNQLFRGTVICSGEGVMQVRNVGDKTLYGSLASELQDESAESPMKARLAILASFISKLGYTAAVLVAFADLFNAIVIDNGYAVSVILSELQNFQTMIGNIFHAALLAISVVVVAVPEGLPMMITVVLSANMVKMQKDHVMVRRLVGIETAGSLNILFTDKTGTLTTGNLAVDKIIIGDGTGFHSSELMNKNTKLSELVAISCVYNSSASVSNGKAIGGNSTERALLTYATPMVNQVMGYKKMCIRDRISEYHDAVTSLLIKAPQNIQELLVKKLKDAANVATVDNRVQRAEKMRTMMGSFGGIMTAMAAMGVIIGLAVIYTSSLISFEELKREISTMMMLGLSSKQCLEVISVGQWLLTVGAIFVGVPMTMAVSKMLSTAMASDLYTIPDFVDARSLVFAVLLTFGAVAISCSLMLKKLRKITPVELLRERE